MTRNLLSIKTQLILTFVAISFIILSAATYFNLTTNIELEKESFVKNSLIQANLLADFTVPALSFMDERGTKESLDKLKNDENIIRAVVFDITNSIFVEYNPSNIKAIPEVKEDFVMLDTKDEFFLESGVLYIYLPLQHNGQKFGTLLVEKSTQSISNTIKEMLNEIILFTAILFVLIYFVSIFYSNFFLQPILKLSQTAEEISATKDYTIRVKDDSENEIGTLYSTFNSLLHETENLTNNLEKEVNIKTKELNKKTEELEDSLNHLKHTQQHLIESEKMSALGNLVSGLAHEVNTPLGNAITSSSVIEKEARIIQKELLDGSLKKSTLDNKLAVINQSSALLGKTLNYASELIKSFKQISVDQVTNDLRLFDIKEYIEEIFLTNHNKLKRVPVEISIYSEEEIHIKNSPGIISQIFNNLIQNSIIHGFENIEKGARIFVNLKKEDDLLTIEYSDNGHGINSQLLQKVYEPFVTTKRNQGGTGLGLNIVYNLVTQKLQGTIEIQSQRNVGTKIIIKMPSEYKKEVK